MVWHDPKLTTMRWYVNIAYLWFSCVVFGKTRVKKGDRKTWQTWLTDIQIFLNHFFTFLHLFFSVTFPHFIHQGNGYDGVQKNIHQGRGKYKSIGFFLVHSVVLFTIIISSRKCYLLGYLVVVPPRWTWSMLASTIRLSAAGCWTTLGPGRVLHLA